MRLKCPNCGAQYEVDATVIPDGGRDVQCSNCGHTWFQQQAQQESEIADAPVAEAPVADTPVAEAPVADTAATPAADQAAKPETTAEPAAHSGQISPKSAPSPEPAAPQRQKIDAQVVNVLRQEADLETAQRSDIPTAPEPEPTPATDQEAAEPKPGFMERSAQLHGPGAATDDYESNRKALLPDIEAINSTLAATSVQQGGDTDTATQEQRRRSGFRRGFSLAVIVFSAMALIYILAPNIADTVPGTATPLGAYVDWINSLRLSANGIMQGAVEKLTGLLALLSNNQAS